MPKAQGGLAAAVVKGKLYAFGGEYFNDGGGVYQQTWHYDPKKDQWSSIGPMLTPRHGLAGVAIDDTIYAVAGAKKASLGETSDTLEALLL
jgi:N-acetylneuraminic acid mutarotase